MGKHPSPYFFLTANIFTSGNSLTESSSSTRTDAGDSEFSTNTLRLRHFYSYLCCRNSDIGQSKYCYCNDCNYKQSYTFHISLLNFINNNQVNQYHLIIYTTLIFFLKKNNHYINLDSNLNKMLSLNAEGHVIDRNNFREFVKI